MKGKCCGLETMLALKNHYYGKSEGEHRKQVAKDDLKRLLYRNKTTFSFEKYVTKMKQTFIVLENYNISLYEKENVMQLSDSIKFPKQQFEN